MRTNSNTNMIPTQMTRFVLGRTFITPGADEALQMAGQTAIEFLRRHMSCDWGDLSEDDQHENELSLKEGYRLLSAYETVKGQRLSGSSLKLIGAQRPFSCWKNTRTKVAARVLEPLAPLTPWRSAPQLQGVSQMSFETTRYKSVQTRRVISLSEREQSAQNQVVHHVRSEIASEFTLTVDRQMVIQAFNTLKRIDRDLMDARAQFNDDLFRRTMRARQHAVSRLRRRWNELNPPLAIPLGRFRRRFHANIAGYLYLEVIGT